MKFLLAAAGGRQGRDKVDCDLLMGIVISV